MSDKEIEVVDLEAEADDNVRVSIPLHMLQGNMKVLLENTVPCNGISFKEHDRGVILVVSGADVFREEWEKLGFRTASYTHE